MVFVILPPNLDKFIFLLYHYMHKFMRDIKMFQSIKREARLYCTLYAYAGSLPTAASSSSSSLSSSATQQFTPLLAKEEWIDLFLPTPVTGGGNRI